MKALNSSEAWFSFKGISCFGYSVRMVSPPTRPHPARKGEYINVPGTDGEIWLDGGGHKNIQISVRCIAEDNINIDHINSWLSGRGELIFGDEPERAYKANVTGEFARNNLYSVMRGQEFTVSFDCEPYRYKADPSGDDLNFAVTYPSTGSWSIANEGSVDSLPLLRVNSSSGGCSITIGDNALTIGYIGKPVYIDCEAKFAYTINDDGSLEFASMYVVGDWPRIAPGLNTLTITSGDTIGNSVSVTITPRWRWL